jgi:sugar phosphate isomerase/epimerase
MRIGLFLALYSDRPFEEALDAAVAAGCETVEIMSGSWSPHCHPGELLADVDARGRFSAHVAERGLTISALSCHANPLHPDRGVASAATRAYRDTVRLAAELGVETVITFSGCPGESEQSLRPSWVTCSWPDDFPETLDWQWETCVLPYWADAAAFARSHDVRVAIEPHPGFVVYNTSSMMRLREAAGDAVGANFDPSHLFWQGMDPLACVRALGDAIFHVHAKDTAFNDEVLAVNGVLEPVPGNRPAERSWIFRSVGEGHPVAFWRDLVAALRATGYEGALSIEHEDPLLSRDEGLAAAVETLRAALDPEVAA